jgi:hypothetical protein
MVVPNIRLDVLENFLHLVTIDNGTVGNRITDEFLYSA